MTVPIRTNVADGDPSHATLHNDVNTLANSGGPDTGWRNITSLLTPAVTSGVVRIKRIGQVVWLQAEDAVFTGAADNVTVSGFPGTGWRADAYLNIPFGAATPGSLHVLIGRPSGIGEVLLRLKSAQSAQGEASWVTRDAWPVTLPGSPA